MHRPDNFGRSVLKLLHFAQRYETNFQPLIEGGGNAVKHRQRVAFTLGVFHPTDDRRSRADFAMGYSFFTTVFF